MCTVSVLAWRERAAHETAPAARAAAPRRLIRLACNRDEQRSRPAALPPVRRRCGAREAVLPIDPVSGGTWIAVNDAGLIATLLNVYDVPARAARCAFDGRRSRGEIIPDLMRCSNLDEAAPRARRLDPERYPPFRLVLVDRASWIELRTDGVVASCTAPRPVIGPSMFTSSGLGDERVEAPRRAVFDELLGALPASVPADQLAAAQDAFHRHRWPDKPHVSVCMEREEALTVSHTVVEVAPDSVAMEYYGAPPDRDATPVRVRIPALQGS